MRKILLVWHHYFLKFAVLSILSRSTLELMMNGKYYCVILAGGQGSRFWPYSRKSYPKQFLDVSRSGESLLQRTYRRMSHIFAPDRVLISTNQAYVDLVIEQLPQLPLGQILAEPCSRNTASAIAYATMHIHALDPNATVVYAPSDHLVEKGDTFHDAIRRALQEASTTREMVTIGIRPTYPETGYGYIQISGGVDESKEMPLEDRRFYPVKTFTEKPNKEMAKVLVESGEFFWNSGLFFCATQTMIEAFRKHLPEVYERLLSHPEVYATSQERAFVNEQFPYCPNISLDYGIMEKMEKVSMLLCDVGWADLGSWGAIYNLSDKDEEANVVLGAKYVLSDSSANLIVSDDPSLLVAMQGITDVILVKKGNVLMVCRRGDEQKLKQLLLQASSLGAEYVE